MPAPPQVVPDSESDPVSPAAPPLPPSPRARRGRLLVALVSVLVLAGTSVLVIRPGPVAGWFSEQPPASSPPTRAPEPSPLPVLVAAAQAPGPTAAGVRAAIHSLVTGANLGGRLGVSVIDVTTGESLYEARASDQATPASTTKLATAVTALATRGPVYRIPTRAVAGSQPGEVVLIGGGDPTLGIDENQTYVGAARLDQLAAQVKKSLGGIDLTTVTVDSTLFTGPVHGPGWDADIPTGGYASAITALMTDGARVDPSQKAPAARYEEPDLAAGRAFAKELGLPASAVRRGTAPDAPADAAPDGEDGADAGSAGDASASSEASEQPSGPPQAGAELGRVESPPLLRLVETMLSESDNVIAEALARQVALARDEPVSFAGAATAMDEVLADLGLPAQESTLYDGSGLSRSNRLTPSVLTDLLGLAADGGHPDVAGVLSGLPVAGWSGTLADRFQAGSGNGRAGIGVVRAKTGTLSGVDSMAGVVRTADGRMLVFALIADGVTAGHWDAQAALDAIAAALARCGCR